MVKNMSQKPIPTKKSFEKDETALALSKMMARPDFMEIPDSYKAQVLGITEKELEQYMTDPNFLRWAVKQMQDLMLANLPEVMQTVVAQAKGGSVKHQKLLLEFTKVLGKQEEEVRSPNIIIVNNIPNPDEFRARNEVVDI
ncbi:MAG: hypothetical protein GX053_15620 [Tissierella sp.]|nr:hypothetical protein [Tissierella sp.]